MKSRVNFRYDPLTLPPSLLAISLFLSLSPLPHADNFIVSSPLSLSPSLSHQDANDLTSYAGALRNRNLTRALESNLNVIISEGEMRSLPNLTSSQAYDEYVDVSRHDRHHLQHVQQQHHQQPLPMPLPLPPQHHHHHHHHHHYNSANVHHHHRPSTTRMSAYTGRRSRHPVRNDSLKRSRSLQMLQSAIRRSIKLITLPKIRDVNIVDRYSRVVFPVVFIIFNTFYWSFYFT